MSKKEGKPHWKDTVGKLIYGKKYDAKHTKHKNETVQDLLKYKEITEKGIVVADGSYFAIIEVSQLNSNLLDFNESQSVWFNFRTMLNSINMRHSYILQSHFYDVGDFVFEYEQNSMALKNLTPQLVEARHDVLRYYQNFSEERNREQRAFMMFRFNPSFEGLEVGLSTGNAKIDDFFTKMKTKSKALDEEETKGIAISMLEEVCDLAYHLLFTIGCDSIRLNREGVLDYMYGILNRDLTVHQKLSDAKVTGMFNFKKYSQTPDIIVNAVDSILGNESILEEYYEPVERVYTDDLVVSDIPVVPVDLNVKEPILEPVVLEETIITETSALSEQEQVQIDEMVQEEIQAEPIAIIEQNNGNETDDSKVVDIQTFTNDTEGLTQEEKRRLRRSLARKRKKERNKTNEHQIDTQGQLQSNG